MRPNLGIAVGTVCVMLVCGASAALAGGGANPTAVALRFAVQPADAIVGKRISGTATRRTRQPLTVEIVDSTGKLVKSSASLTIRLRDNPSGSRLGGAITKHAVNGVAKFTDLTLNKPGNGYTLTASSPGLKSATSNTFDENDTAAVCEQGKTCSTELETPVSGLHLTASPMPNSPSAGTITESFDVGKRLSCAGYAPRDSNWYEFVASSLNRAKMVGYTLKNTIPGRNQVCLGAPYEFTTRSGAPAPAGTLPSGKPGYIGLLPSCSQSGGGSGERSGPCVRSITEQRSKSETDTIVTFQIPSGLPGDPWARM